VERGKRIRIKFSKEERMKYISHLDLLRTMERAIRRSGLPIAYTEGFHPRVKVQFASALPVGIASKGELMDLELREDITALDALGRLKNELPSALAPQKGAVVPQNEGPLMSLVEGASYSVSVEPQDDLTERIALWLAKETIPWQRQRKNKVRRLDLRRATSKITVTDGDRLELFLFFSSEEINVRPQEIIASLELMPLGIVRTAIFGQGVLLRPLEKGIE
jgi:radical SAM-linked protein